MRWLPSAQGSAEFKKFKTINLDEEDLNDVNHYIHAREILDSRETPRWKWKWRSPGAQGVEPWFRRGLPLAFEASNSER